MFVLYSKDKRHSQDNQDKEVVQTKYRERKNPAGGMDVFFLSILPRRGLFDGPIPRPEKPYRL